MPFNRPRRGSQDFGPRGAGQLDEVVRVQRVTVATADLQTNPTYDDIVTGGTPETVAASQRFASILLLEGETKQEVPSMAGDVTQTRYRVRLRHMPEVTTHYRFVWRGVFLNIESADHQTERRAGYSEFVCVHNADQPNESLTGGSVAGGGTPNTSGEISTLPIQ